MLTKLISLSALYLLTVAVQPVVAQTVNDSNKSAHVGNLETTVANQFLRNLPDTIPGAKQVNKFEVDNAQYVLVHIKNRHQTGGDSAVTNNIQLVQQDVYTILSYLDSQQNLDYLFSEGVSEQNQTQVATFAQQVQYFFGKGQGSATTKEKNKVLESVIAKEGREATKKFLKQLKELYDNNAEYRLAGQGKIQLLPANSFQVYQFSKGAFQRHATVSQGHTQEFAGSPEEFEQFIYELHDMREDELLKIIAMNNISPVAVTLYGSNHEFGGLETNGASYQETPLSTKDNIAEWNQQNPGNKFSLIEIFPASLDMGKGYRVDSTYTE